MREENAIEEALSSAATPTSMKKDVILFLTGQNASPFFLSDSEADPFQTLMPVLKDKLFFTCLRTSPLSDEEYKCFTINKKLRYAPFCADFGPFNLGTTHHFCDVVMSLLTNEALENKKIVFYCPMEKEHVTNAVYLLGAFLVLKMGASVLDVMHIFSGLPAGVLRPYRDATWVKSTYDLKLEDCWSGLIKAVAAGLYNPLEFHKEEYFYYDDPYNGDMHEVVPGKFLAFRGPRGNRSNNDDSLCFIPSDYFEVFRCYDVGTIVRLNSPEYPKEEFLKGGFEHHDLVFPDCSIPPARIINDFLKIAETSKKAIAVHCLAGLGRTGTLIAIYIMKHYYFTAAEAIAWLRICRPGSVIGPQQNFLEDIQGLLHETGRKKIIGFNADISQRESAYGNKEYSEKLAYMVTESISHRGMHISHRTESSESDNDQRDSKITHVNEQVDHNEGGSHPQKQQAAKPASKHKNSVLRYLWEKRKILFSGGSSTDQSCKQKAGPTLQGLILRPPYRPLPPQPYAYRRSDPAVPFSVPGVPCRQSGPGPAGCHDSADFRAGHAFIR
eukprot:746724-Hanusia_phi.AAC.3